MELAALVAGLVAATAAGDDPAEPERPAAWSDRGRRLPGARASWRPGPDTWRWSAR
ncbi:acyl-CoA carboxylase subunit epsilon [Cellulomonas denverensis]|uniref:Acyl-CoA carboxylase subunit epsilon n=2 Tax=Cellulomonas denverensis TaxID=264297 RepID=A0A7X6QXH4_9CELL|nr:acyl-CoA carboxylase subunit epsilon [Cellulomonas denverensis]